MAETERLYLSDPYLKEWTARVSGIKLLAGKTFVILDRTSFHPMGGGQPGDRGSIGGVPVVDTIVKDGEILHQVDGTLVPGEYPCELDWERRFPLMQLHTGEHLFFSRLRLVNPDIQIDKVLFAPEEGRLFLAGELSFKEIAEAEEMTNSAIARAIPVTTHFFGSPAEALAAFPSSRLKEERLPEGARIRILEIDKEDCSACSGTHLASTAEIGQFKVTWVNRAGGGLAIRFCAGDAAAAASRNLANSTVELGLTLQLEPEKLMPAVINMKAENRRLLETARSLSKDALAAAESLPPEEIGGLSARLLDFSGKLDKADLAELAKKFTSQHQSAAILFGGLEAEYFTVILAASPDLRQLDLNKLAGIIFPIVEGRGGGKPGFVSGSGKLREAIPQAISAARDWLSLR